MYQTLEKTINNGFCYEQSETLYIRLDTSNYKWSYHVALVTNDDSYGCVDCGDVNEIGTCTAYWWYNKMRVAIEDVVEQYYGMGCIPEDVEEWTKQVTEADFADDKWKEHYN